MQASITVLPADPPGECALRTGNGDDRRGLATLRRQGGALINCPDQRHALGIGVGLQIPGSRKCQQSLRQNHPPAVEVGVHMCGARDGGYPEGVAVVGDWCVSFVAL